MKKDKEIVSLEDALGHSRAPQFLDFGKAVAEVVEANAQRLGISPFEVAGALMGMAVERAITLGSSKENAVGLVSMVFDDIAAHSERAGQQAH